MGTAYRAALASIRAAPQRWLVTGAAGFIGSNLVHALVEAGQEVVGFDDFSTGHLRNLEDVQSQVGPTAWSRFRLVRADIRDVEACRLACQGVDVVLHEAALGSVPRSLRDPATTNSVNVDGTLNVLIAARDERVRRVVYAASSSTYGDHPGLPKVEREIGRPLSPYAVTKLVNELYAEVFGRCYQVDAVGLRYFNVFGPRQDPDGAYAAVIPRWVSAMLSASPVIINGDGETSRDFCFVANVVQANILAAIADPASVEGQVFNVAVGQRTTLRDLHSLIKSTLTGLIPELIVPEPQYADFRPGDVRHSLADISKARGQLGYEPSHTVRDGMTATMPWYVRSLRAR